MFAGGIGSLAGLGLSLGPIGCRRAVVRTRTPSEAYFDAISAGDGAKVARLVGENPGLISAHDERSRSGFTVAILGGHLAIADHLSAVGYQTDVVEAAWVGDWERFAELSSARPAQVNQHHELGGTAMYAGARGGGGAELWRIYAAAGLPNPPRPTPDAQSPLRAALEVRDLGVAELTAATLLSNGANPNAAEPAGSSALHAAAARGSAELVEMLIRKGADLAARDDRGRTATDIARGAAVSTLAGAAGIARDHVALRRAFDASGAAYVPANLADIPLITQRSFVGLGHGRMEELARRLEREPRLVHATATTTEMAVEAAGHTGRIPIVEYLLARGAPLSMPAAVVRGRTDEVGALLDRGAERVHERGPHDFALLWYPVIGGGNTDMAELLLSRGADVEAQHYLGTTALHWAARADQIDMAALLIDAGANVNRIGRKFSAEGHTPLDLALQRKSERTAALLRARGGKTRR